MTAALAAVIAGVLFVPAVVVAQEPPEPEVPASVEVTVWRRVANPSLLYVSTRPEGGTWRTLNTPLDMSRLSASRRFHQSNAVTVEVPLSGGTTANVEVTVWRRVANPSLLYVSTRPEGGTWHTLDTPLDMSRLSASRRFHQSNAVTVEVPLPPTPTPTPTPATASDRAVLVALYNATGGPNWASNTNWLSDRPIGEWLGVNTDGSGRVIGLELGSNGLTGRIPSELGGLANLQSLLLAHNRLSGGIPSELGRLANLQELWLNDNRLSGGIPAELGNLAKLRLLWLQENQLSGPFPDSFTGLDALNTLAWFSTGLCAPTDAAFQAWLRGVASTDGENCAAAAPSDRAALVALYTATDGPNWANNTNWLSDRPIGEWLGVSTDSSGRVIALELGSNGLTGSIPSELGRLANLQSLLLAHNRLSGGIPAELGRLANLESLWLNDNRLSGGIPAELGNLPKLRLLWLQENQLSGPFPASFTGLGALNTLAWFSTGLCAPTDAAFQAWLGGVASTDGENCAEPASNDSDNDDDG